MAKLLEAKWPIQLDGRSRRDRRGGSYRSYLPDPLVKRPLVFDRTIARRTMQLENLVSDTLTSPGAHALECSARFLLRSEAIASSRIEGLQVSAQQVALAELAQNDGEQQLKGFSENARLVANNVTMLRKAATDVAAENRLTVRALDGLHRALLPDERHHGLRSVQNWLGGSNWHPLDAEFVPPPPDQVRPLMEDLVDYLDGATHPPLIQAGVAHAQFETIHPYTDGNGRVGRALIHTVLARRGLTRTAVLPVSLVLFTNSDAYVDGLTAFRYEGPMDSPGAQSAVARWISVFLDAVEIACAQARTFADELGSLRTAWLDRLGAHRQAAGLRPAVRAGSSVERILDVLPSAPVLTASSAQHLLGSSYPATRNALEELADAGVLARKQLGRGTRGYLARDIFDLLTLTERRLASTRWDTRSSPPIRPVPALPVGPSAPM